MSKRSQKPETRSWAQGELSHTQYIAQAGVIAAIYAGATIITGLFLQGLAWGPVQLRISEALCVVAVLTPAAIPGLTVGCALANLIMLSINGLGALGLFDVIFGSFATFFGALWAWHWRAHKGIALLGPVIFNALIVPAYLPVLLQGIGYYVIPFTTISIENAYGAMYLFGVCAIAIGEAIVIYGIGLPLLMALTNSIRVSRRSQVQ